MNDTPQPVSPATLKFLARLVTVLTATMIGGLLVIVALLVIRFWTPQQGLTALPDRITLPAGAHATAVTRGTGWFAVVARNDSTDTESILIFDAESGKLRQTVAINAR